MIIWQKTFVYFYLKLDFLYVLYIFVVDCQVHLALNFSYILNTYPLQYSCLDLVFSHTKAMAPDWTSSHAILMDSQAKKKLYLRMSLMKQHKLLI